MAVNWTIEQYYALSGKRPALTFKKNKKLVIAGGYTSNYRGWRVIGGKKCYFKSLWEVNYAYYLEWQKKRKEIYDWEYEPVLFRFPTSKYKAGPFLYRPDFKVWRKPNKFTWVEVKGVLNPKAKKKLKRFHLHHPKQGKITVVGAEWFAGMKNLRGIIPGWETIGQLKSRRGY